MGIGMGLNDGESNGVPGRLDARKLGVTFPYTCPPNKLALAGPGVLNVLAFANCATSGLGLVGPEIGDKTCQTADSGAPKVDKCIFPFAAGDVISRSSGLRFRECEVSSSAANASTRSVMRKKGKYRLV